MAKTQDKDHLLETIEEKKGMDTCQYAEQNLVLQTAFNNKKLCELGYPTFTEFYLKVCENQGTAVYGTVCTV